MPQNGRLRCLDLARSTQRGTIGLWCWPQPRGQQHGFSHRAHAAQDLRGGISSPATVGRSAVAMAMPAVNVYYCYIRCAPQPSSRNDTRRSAPVAATGVLRRPYPAARAAVQGCVLVQERAQLLPARWATQRSHKRNEHRCTDARLSTRTSPAARRRETVATRGAARLHSSSSAARRFGTRQRPRPGFVRFRLLLLIAPPNNKSRQNNGCIAGLGYLLRRRAFFVAIL